MKKFRLFIVVTGIMITGIVMQVKAMESVCFNEVIQKTANQKSGKLFATDKKGDSIILDWQKIAVSDPAFIAKMKSLKNIFIEAHTQPNVELLKIHPEAASLAQELKYFEQFFKKGPESVDWHKIEELMKIGMSMYWEKFTQTIDPTNVCWFITVRDTISDEPIAFAQFISSPKHANGSIRLKNLMIRPHAQHRGLGKLLISTMFKIVSSIKRIFLSTLVTNTQAQQAYKSYGFKQFAVNNPIEFGSLDEYELHFEYLTDQSDILQKCAETLNETGKE